MGKMIRKKRPQLTTLGTRQVTLQGQTVSYLLKRSPTARFARLEIRRETGLTVVIPRDYPTASLMQLMASKTSWILSKLARCAQTPILSAQGGLQSGDTIPYLGGSIPLAITRSDDHYTRVSLDEGNAVVSLAEGHRLTVALEGWYRWRAAHWISDRVRDLSARLGLKHNKITIRGQRSRWGSCSQKGNLSFNWKLLMAPEPVIDYVIIHELCHLKEMNHQKCFWTLVAQFCPRWREYKKWLTDHQAELSSRLST